MPLPMSMTKEQKIKVRQVIREMTEGYRFKQRKTGKSPDKTKEERLTREQIENRPPFVTVEV
jgi:hypothetical protein